MLDLRKMCLEHGFHGSGGKYFRIIGDGVMQGIFEWHTGYIDPSSPEYSEQHRKAKYITVGLWSLYSELDESIFIREESNGLYGLSNFEGKCWNSDPFMGNQHDRKLLADLGLPLLDRIKTQNQLADVIIRFSTLEYGGLLPQQISIFGAFMKSGRKSEALQRVQACFTHFWLPRLERYKGTLTVEELAEFFSSMPTQLEESQKLARMWGLCLIDTQDCIDAYLQKNYDTNIERALRANIPIIK